MTLLAALVSLFVVSEVFALSDAAIKRLMIEDSISRYSGNCPCPYSLARNGSRCGKRSAWSRPGGASPLCYARDIGENMLEAYARRYNLRRDR